jgi:ankyrin repeat protein
MIGKKRDRIMEKCCDTHYTKAELQAFQIANFSTPPNSIEEFVLMWVKLTQQGPRHRLPFLLSKPWVKSWQDFVPKLLDEEKCHHHLLQSALINNEDFMRMLLTDSPRDQLSRFGSIKNKEQETMLHVLCKGASARAYPSSASRADIVDLLLTVCPLETFDLEARDLRGQTPLHLAAQSGDIGLVQVLLEYGADPNAQEETTGWTPLHFAVAKAHYQLILQLLHHDATNVNQVDKFDWPPLLEACSRLDSRSTALLVNGGAHLGFRNQHQFDVLKAVDTSKKDLAAKRWMSCLVVSNGFKFAESTVQLNPDDRETLERERAYFESRQVPAANPPFYVPDHLAPRCHSCKVLFSVTVRRYHCRSCGLVLCGDCFKWRATHIVALDERLKSRQMVAQGATPYSVEEDEGQRPLNESRLNAAVEMSIRERGGPKNPQGPPSPATTTAPVMQPGRVAPSFRPDVPPAEAGQVPRDDSIAPDRRHSPGGMADSSTTAPGSPGRSDDSFEDPPLAEELPAVGPPMSVICPASMSNLDQGTAAARAPAARGREQRPMRGGLSRERNAMGAAARGNARMVRLCTSCVPFFEVGVGETYAMLQRKEALHATA